MRLKQQEIRGGGKTYAEITFHNLNTLGINGRDNSNVRGFWSSDFLVDLLGAARSEINEKRSWEQKP